MDTDVFRHQADEILAMQRVWFDLALDGHRVAQKQAETVMAASREALLLQRDQQEAWGRMALDLWFGKQSKPAPARAEQP
jgi:hypothetical protein